MNFWADHLHIVIEQSKFVGVSITKEIASFELLAVASYLHADSVMIKSVTILWIGNSWILLSLFFNH